MVCRQALTAQSYGTALNFKTKWLHAMKCFLVKYAQTVVKPRTVVNCAWEDTFGIYYAAKSTSKKVQISLNERFDPVHIIPV